MRGCRHVKRLQGCRAHVATCNEQVCANPEKVVERLRAGEHHVLQVLCAPPVPDVPLLIDTPWLPVLRGEARLYEAELQRREEAAEAGTAS